MTYVKLHGGIIHSSVWSAPDHVRLVWITMLAMKDHLGFVDAGVWGIAKASNVSIEKTQEAIDYLQKPDPHSKTPDNEGRRIAPCGDGWTILNHFKYRDLVNEEERRAKDAERQREKRASKTVRKRPDPSGLVQDRPRSSGKSDIRSDQITSGQARSGSGSGVDPVSSQPPDQGGGGDREQPWSERWEVTQRPTASPQRAQAHDPTDARANERKRLLRTLVDAHALIFNRVRDEVGAQVPAMRPAGLGDPAERELQALLDIQVTLDGFEARARHVLAVREDEARRKRTVKFLGPSLWRPTQFGIAGSMQVGEDRSGVPNGPSAFDVIDQTVARIEAEQELRDDTE